MSGLDWFGWLVFVSCGWLFSLYETNAKANKRKVDEHMLEFLKDLFQIFVMFWVMTKVLKFTVKRMFRIKSKGKYGKKRVSLIGKVWLLISRQLHSRLDGMLKQQSVTLREKKKNLEEKPATATQQSSNEKVIQFKNYKRQVVK